MCSVLPASKRIGRRNAFELITEERVYNLFADDAETMNEWIACIKTVINHHDPSQLQVFYFLR